MKRKIPPPNGKITSTQVFQPSTICFYWSVLREQATASTRSPLQSTTSGSNRQYPVEKQNNNSTSRNQHRKKVESCISRLGGNKKPENGTYSLRERSNKQSSLHEHVAQSQEPQNEGHNAAKDKQKVVDTLKQWLPHNFHELLYGVLTIVCLVEALRIGSVPLPLMGLWTAAAAQIGVPTANSAFTTIMERIVASKDKLKK